MQHFERPSNHSLFTKINHALRNLTGTKSNKLDMRRSIRSVKLFCVLLVAAFGTVAALTAKGPLVQTVESYSSGPPGGHTGAPGEATCTACHDSSGGPGQFMIIAPQTYIPGQTYQIEVRHATTDATRLRWGFELTALTGSANAGTFTNTSTNTQIINKSDRNYI